jgi:ribosomal protein S18 acetylase RimI-like enzyme
VGDACRGQGVGSKLMRMFFHLCPEARRVVLWVITTNENAITKYDHYHFKPDGLLDQVMIKPHSA